MRARFHCSFAGRLMLLALVGAVWCHAERTTDQLERETIAKLRKEHERRSELVAWARENKPKPIAYLAHFYRPMIEGNMSDVERNTKLSEKYMERARSAKQKRQEETAVKYAKVAKMFADLAAENKKILTCLRAGKTEDMQQACRDLTKIESQIKQLTGKTVPREWFTDDEMAIPLPPKDSGGKWEGERENEEKAGEERAE